MHKPINLHAIRKLIEYSLKAMFTLTVFDFTRYCYSKVGWYYHPPSGGQEAKGLRETQVKVSVHGLKFLPPVIA